MHKKANGNAGKPQMMTTLNQLVVGLKPHSKPATVTSLGGGVAVQASAAQTTGSCTLEKCNTGVGLNPVMPWLYAPRAILSSATSTNMSTWARCVFEWRENADALAGSAWRCAHPLLVFSAQKIEKPFAIASTSPYTKLLPATLRQYNTLECVGANLRGRVRGAQRRRSVEVMCILA
jgi:hypothetical protein